MLFNLEAHSASNQILANITLISVNPSAPRKKYSHIKSPPIKLSMHTPLIELMENAMYVLTCMPRYHFWLLLVTMVD